MVFSFEVFDGHIQHDQVHGTVQVPSAKRAKRLLGDSKRPSTSPGPGQRDCWTASCYLNLKNFFWVWPASITGLTAFWMFGIVWLDWGEALMGWEPNTSLAVWFQTSPWILERCWRFLAQDQLVFHPVASKHPLKTPGLDGPWDHWNTSCPGLEDAEQADASNGSCWGVQFIQKDRFVGQPHTIPIAISRMWMNMIECCRMVCLKKNAH